MRWGWLWRRHVQADGVPNKGDINRDRGYFWRSWHGQRPCHAHHYFVWRITMCGMWRHEELWLGRREFWGILGCRLFGLHTSGRDRNPWRILCICWDEAGRNTYGRKVYHQTTGWDTPTCVWGLEEEGWGWYSCGDVVGPGRNRPCIRKSNGFWRQWGWEGRYCIVRLGCDWHNNLTPGQSGSVLPHLAAVHGGLPPEVWNHSFQLPDSVGGAEAVHHGILPIADTLTWLCPNHW